MIFRSEMINFVRFSAMIFPSEMTVFLPKITLKKWEHTFEGEAVLFLWQGKWLSFRYGKRKSPPVEMRGKKIIPKRSAVISKRESAPCHIEMRRTNPPPINNQSICFHLKMTVILRPPKWLSFIISARSVIAKNVPIKVFNHIKMVVILSSSEWCS